MDDDREESFEELKQLYEAARKVKPNVALEMVMEAQTDEERKFYAFVMNMNLQRAEQLAIQQNKF